MVACGIQVSHNACVSVITGASESHTRSTSFPAALRQARRNLGAGLLQLRFIEPRDRDSAVTCF